jgi:hypothetical protein
MIKYEELNEAHLKSMNGGSEFSESVFRLAGYLTQKVKEGWNNYCDKIAQMSDNGIIPKGV